MLIIELYIPKQPSESGGQLAPVYAYKCKSDWEDHKEKERMLNGIYANLETNDIALKSLFNELAYQHFKNRNWEALIRTKFRLKFQLIPLKMELAEIFDSDIQFGKAILKIDREDILKKIAMSDLSIPININNLIYLINHFENISTKITELTPDIIKNYS